VLEDTIIAISTPPGFGGLGIVRISGPEALAVAGKIFRRKGRAKGRLPVRRPILGMVRDPDSGRALDEAFLTYFRAPRSYTREDVVELSAHGSPAVLEAILLLGTKAGARLARPGEFTLRAYINGRLDMLQAQAVDDLIRSVSLAQARISSRHLSGSLSRRVFQVRTRLAGLLSRLEAELEFPDDLARGSDAAARKTLSPLIGELERLVASYETGRALAEGVTLAIVGRTNVGKSTLFNALLEEERAIVTPFPGTTRDFLRERLVLGGVLFHLVDMAGLGKAAHPVERTGMDKGRKIAGGADGLIIVLDGSRRESDEDKRLIRTYQGKKAIIVLNKSDLPRRFDGRALVELSRAAPLVEVSALKGTGMDLLRSRIGALFAPGPGVEEEMVLHAWQKDILEAILKALVRARGLLEEGHPREVVAEEIRTAVRLIGELAGEVRTDEIMDRIFSRFCVGK
jgi:tRNA modification GTPase